MCFLFKMKLSNLLLIFIFLGMLKLLKKSPFFNFEARNGDFSDRSASPNAAVHDFSDMVGSTEY
jgi:hypothetical protein